MIEDAANSKLFKDDCFRKKYGKSDPRYLRNNKMEIKINPPKTKKITPDVLERWKMRRIGTKAIKINFTNVCRKESMLYVYSNYGW